MRIALLIVAAVALTRTSAYSAGTQARFPVRELGTIVYFVPRQRAEADIAAHGHGFVAFVLQQTNENNIKPTFVARSAAEFIADYERLPRELQQQGIWLLLQREDPYSAHEKGMLEQLKVLCAKHKFPLSIRTRRKDKHWQSFNGIPHSRSNHAMERTANRPYV